MSPSAAMDEPRREPSAHKPDPAKPVRPDREDRLAKALRENLRRRKGLQKPSGQPPDPT